MIAVVRWLSSYTVFLQSQRIQLAKVATTPDSKHFDKFYNVSLSSSYDSEY